MAIYLLQKEYGDNWREYADPEFLEYYDEMMARKNPPNTVRSPLLFSVYYLSLLQSGFFQDVNLKGAIYHTITEYGLKITDGRKETISSLICLSIIRVERGCRHLYKKRGINMIMNPLLDRRKFNIAFTLFITALIFAGIGRGMENSLPGTWSFSCETKLITYPDDIIQLGDTMFFAHGNRKTGPAVCVFKSLDGCSWSEIESPLSDCNKASYSVTLFEVPGGNLGIAWERTEPDNKKPRSTFYWSALEDSTWSEPEFLFSRDEPCTLKDALMLEDGSLLFLWDEPLVKYTEFRGTIVRGSGCDVTYRAYVGKDELIIERVIEPENPSYCYIAGYSFIDDGERIWCVFYYGSYKQLFCRSWSEDGRQWSKPEAFTISGPPSRQVLRTSQGEFGIFCYDIFDKDFILFTSQDWEKWSKERLFKTRKDIFVALITDGNNGMWGIFDTGDEIFFIQPSQEREQKYQEKIVVIRALRYISLACIALLVIYVLLSLWKAASTSEPK